jgi:hypothetical protein
MKPISNSNSKVVVNLFRSFGLRAFLSSFRWYRIWYGGRWEYWRVEDGLVSFVWFAVSNGECWPTHRPLASSGTPVVENWPAKLSA